MSKVTLLDLSSAIASSIISAVNTNNIALRAALDNTLSRDGTTPNQMQATLDMNSNTIINLPAAIGATEPVRKFEFDALSVSMTTSTAAAAASATAAAASAVAAAASAASASTTLVNFNNTYLGVFASAPSVNNTGGGLINGNLYFNSTILAFQIYNTGIWYTGVSSNVTSAANSIKGNNTGSTAAAIDLTAAQVKTLLAVSLTSDVTGTLQAAQFPALTGDVTTSAGALGTTIASGAVTLAKQANLAANSIQGNNTGSAATPIALTAAQVKTLLAVSLTSDVTGVLQAAQEPAHTGDVTNTAGSLALTIASGVVTNAKAATMAANTIKINNTAGVAAPIDGTVAQTKTLLAISTSDVSGLAAVASSGSAADLSTGTLLAARMPALTGDVTSTVNTVSTTIAANAVTNAKAAQMAANTFKGNNTGSTANSIDLTVTQATAMLNNVVGDAGSGGTKGLVPAPAAGDAVALKFLKADGTWAIPNAGVGSPGGTNGQIQYNNSTLFGGFTASGDIAIVTSTGVATIQANVVDNTKIRQGGAASVIGNSTSSTANVADISAASDNTMLGRASGTLSFRKIVDADLTTNTITSASLAQMAANTFKGNNTASTANASDLTVDQMQVALNIHSFTTARWLGMN
jgi:hypothetical protein